MIVRAYTGSFGVLPKSFECSCSVNSYLAIVGATQIEQVIASYIISHLIKLFADA